MFHCKYDEGFHGFSIGRVERNQNFTANLGYFKNEYQIHYIFKGERYFFASGSCYKMQGGSIAFLDKEKIAKTCIIGGKYHDRLLIEIEGETFLPMCKLLGIDMKKLFHNYYGVYQVQNCNLVQSFLTQAEALVLNKTETMRETRLKLLILELLASSYQLEPYKIDIYNSIEVQGSLEKQKRVYQIADYITNHYTEIWSLDELSHRFFMSKAYMSRIFKEVTNFTISEYINLYRIAASKEYLLSHSCSMTELANILGFNSLTYFERVFKQEMSVTPLQYRKMKMNQRIE